MATWTAWHPGGARAAVARRRAPHGLVVLALLALGTLRAGVAVAGEAPPTQFVLPLLATLALGRSVFDLRANNGITSAPVFARGGVPAKPNFVPSFLSIPDLYAVDVTDRDPPRFAEPVDRHKQLSLNLLPRSLSSDRSLSVVYDTENLPAFRDTSRLIRLKFEVDF